MMQENDVACGFVISIDEKLSHLSIWCQFHLGMLQCLLDRNRIRKTRPYGTVNALASSNLFHAEFDALFWPKRDPRVDLGRNRGDQREAKPTQH
jgi:hypothetical protein